MSRLAAVVALSLAVSACGKSGDKPAPPPPGGGTAAAGTGSTAPAPPQAPGTVVVFVDDKPVATLDQAKVATWPRIDGIVPEAAQRLGTWESVTIKAAADQELKSPADRFPSLVPAVYPGPDGPAFGMFDVVDLAKKAAPRGGTAANVREIRIKLAADSDRGQNEEGGKATFDPNQIEVTIEGGTKPRLTGTEILDLPRESPPNGDVNTQGWKLTTLMTAAGIKNPKKVLLTDASSTKLALTAAELDPAKSVPFLKLNRQGQLRFRLYTKQGEGWVLGGSLRGLSSIKVVE